MHQSSPSLTTSSEKQSQGGGAYEDRKLQVSCNYLPTLKSAGPRADSVLTGVIQGAYKLALVQPT